ncbi:hypothetical protein GF342_04470 [Candidatus Woesearchaeota archaeon]|nr:hypothetical protein [Candidatus Woesearchaeota archaeon]
MSTFLRFFLLILLVSTAVSAARMTLPAERQFLFEPGKTYTVQFGVVTQPGTPTTVIVEDGPLKQYTTANPDVVKGSERKLERVDLTIKLPNEEWDPGVYTLSYRVEEAFKEGATARGAVRTTLDFINAFDGTYPVISVTAENGVFGEPLPITISVRNYGTQEIQSAQSHVKVFYRDELVREFDTVSKKIPFLAHESLSHSAVIAEGTPGQYRAEVTTMIDGAPHQHEVHFFLGQPDIVVVDYNRKAEIGRVNDLSVKLLNIWDGIVHGRMELSMMVNGTLITALNPEVGLESWKESTHSLFFSVPSYIKPGTYQGTLKTSFLGATKEMRVAVEFVEQASVEVPEENVPVWTAGLILLLLLAVALLLLTLARVRRNSRLPKKQVKVKTKTVKEKIPEVGNEADFDF